LLLYRIDELDRAISSLLLEDGRMTCSEISRRLDGKVAERTVNARIRRLVTRGIIRVQAVVNPRALGYGFIADMWIEVVAGRQREVVDELVKIVQVSYVAYSTGDRDLSVQLCARDMQDLHHLVNEVVGQIPGIVRTGVTLVPVMVKDSSQWPIPEDPPINLGRQPKRAKLTGTSEPTRANLTDAKVRVTP
jgi:Lrp/AsnC family transcriptional regulator, regulator for asnA, asnC and gidA